MDGSKSWRQRIKKLPAVRRSRSVWWPLWQRTKDLLLLPGVVPGLAFNGRQRALFSKIWRFTRELPQQMMAPLPQAMAQLTPELAAERPHPRQENNIRRLADLAILLDRRSPLGLCLRRALTRYYFLRRAGLPLQIHYGARFDSGRPDRAIAGHAWLTLDGQPYYEAGRNWRGFTIMLSFPKTGPSEATDTT